MTFYSFLLLLRFKTHSDYMLL